MNNDLKTTVLKNRLKTSSLNGKYVIDSAFTALLLTMNVSNYRSISKDRVDAYANDMASGKWKTNGEPIIISKEGILLDGQHRLKAIIKANVSIVCYIVFDAEPCNTLDVGCSRTINNMFRAEGRSLNVNISAIGRMYLDYGSECELHGTQYIHDFIVSREEELRESFAITAFRSTRGSVGKKSACGTLVYCLLKNKEISAADMREFFSILNTGNTPGTSREASPALVLRKQLLELPKAGGRAMRKYVLEVTYKALCDFKDGVVRKRFYSPESDDAERLVRSIYRDEEKSKYVA